MLIDVALWLLYRPRLGKQIIKEEENPATSEKYKWIRTGE
jgi:hypothetical protein